MPSNLSSWTDYNKTPMTNNNLSATMSDQVASQKTSIVQTLYDFSIPVICFIGFTGNGMAVVLIQTNHTLRRFQSNVFLSALAVCSCIFLTTLLCLWIEPYTPDWKLYSSHVGCKLLTYCAHCADFACVWFIVFVCIDRMAVLQLPEFRSKAYCKVSAQAMILWMLLIIGVGHVWVLFLAEPINFYGAMTCAAPSENYDLYSFFNLLETIFGILIPTVIIIFTNAIIVWKLVVYHRKNILFYTPSVRFSEVPQHVTTERSQLLNAPESRDCISSKSRIAKHDTNKLKFPKKAISLQYFPQQFEKPNCIHDDDDCNASDDNSSACSQVQFITYISTTPHLSTPGGAGGLTHPMMKSSEFKLIRTILVLTTIFVLMNVPSYMCRLFFSSILGSGKPWLAWLWLVSYLLYYSHHSILFYIYIFNSEQMRKELRPAALKLLECYCLKPVPDFGHYHGSNH